MLILNELKFGDVLLTWDASVPFPIAVNHLKLNGEKPLVVLCDIAYTYAGITKIVPAGFGFDGASIPWIFQWLPGYSKIGWHLFADLIHDFSCECPWEVPRPIGDGIYLSLLLAMADAPVVDYQGTSEELSALQKKRRKQAWRMHRAVSWWTWVQYKRGVPILGRNKIMEKSDASPSPGESSGNKT